MVIWSGIGFNYGHDVTVANYSTTQVESDFAFLRAAGVSKIRIVYPYYGNNTGLIPCAQDMVLRALAHGFYVVWGIGGDGTQTATNWATMKTYITGTLASWAKTNGLSELALGNEVEIHVDGTTLTTATVRSDVRSMATTVKAGGFTGLVSYGTTASDSFRLPWASEGIGALDKLGLNLYFSLSGFTSRANLLIPEFGASVYISEFGTQGGGFSDYNNDENAYAIDVLARMSAMQSAGIPSGYFFCYRDGGSFGIPANTQGIVQTNNVAHCIRGAILNTPGQPILGAFGVHA